MKADIVVIGGGIVGCMTAVELAGQGAKVTIVEQNSLGSGSSWAGGGIVLPLMPWKYSDRVNQLALPGVEIYAGFCERLFQETGVSGEYLVSGMRVEFESGYDEALTWCHEHAFDVDEDSRQQQLWMPSVAQVRPPRVMQAMRIYLAQQGISVIEQAQMQPLQANTGKVSTWSDSLGNQHTADYFVLTAGAWSADVLGDHALGLPVKPMRGQILLYEPRPELLQELRYRTDFYLIPRADGHILAGSTVEDVGFDWSTTDEAAQALKAKAEHLLPALAHVPIVKHWSGLRPGSPDNIPIIARHPQLENLILNTGHFRYGLTMAPMSARMVAALITNSAPPLPLENYAYPI